MDAQLLAQRNVAMDETGSSHSLEARARGSSETGGVEGTVPVPSYSAIIERLHSLSSASGGIPNLSIGPPRINSQNPTSPHQHVPPVENLLKTKTEQNTTTSEDHNMLQSGEASVDKGVSLSDVSNRLSLSVATEDNAIEQSMGNLDLDPPGYSRLLPPDHQALYESWENYKK